MLSLDSLAVRRLTFASGSPGDYNPAFSPDGETLAFNRGSQGITAIYTKPVAGGEEHRVTAGSQFGWGLAWTANGRDIVFGRAAWLGRSGWLWKVSFQGGEPERLQFGQEGSEPSIRGNRLAYARQIMRSPFPRSIVREAEPSEGCTLRTLISLIRCHLTQTSSLSPRAFHQKSRNSSRTNLQKQSKLRKLHLNYSLLPINIASRLSHTIKAVYIQLLILSLPATIGPLGHHMSAVSS